MTIFYAEPIAKLLQARNEWNTVTAVRTCGKPVAAISSEELANTAAHRAAHAQNMGQRLPRIHAVEARRMLPSQCAFVLTIEDDIEMRVDRAILPLLKGWTAARKRYRGS